MKPKASFLLFLCPLLGLVVLPRTQNPATNKEDFLETSTSSKTAQASTGTFVPEISSTKSVQILEKLSKLPLSFETNQGQSHPKVKFLSRGRGYTLFLTPTEAVLALHRSAVHTAPHKLDEALVNTKLADARTLPPAVLRVMLVGASLGPQISGREALPGKVNYLIGNDPKKWRTNIPTYARVEYQHIYPGVNLIYHGRKHQLEYDLVVTPSADRQAIQLAFEGADSLTMDKKGNLVLGVDGRELILHAPVIYQESDGRKRTISGGYVLKGKDKIGFQIGTYDARKPLIIDPVLGYSTYLGSTGSESGNGIALDPEGNVYLTGSTNSVNFPIANAWQPRFGSGTCLGSFPFDGSIACPDVFVAKLNSTGDALIYSTYLGGRGEDSGSDIDADSEGNAYVTGTTASPDFPTINPVQAAFGGGICKDIFSRSLPCSDAFAAKLNPTGSLLTYSTYLGGSGDDSGSFPSVGDDDGGGIAADAFGNAYVTGTTTSRDFPTANPLQSAFGGVNDAYVAKLNPDGSVLVYSTYLGGSASDSGSDIAVDTSGNAYVTGGTSSANFPTANPLQAVPGGGLDAFVAKLNATGSALVYSTYLGGAGGFGVFDLGSAIAVDVSGHAYVTGQTNSSNFATRNPLQGALSPGNCGGGEFFIPCSDAFITKLSSAGTGLIYSTYLGGTRPDSGSGIAVDRSGNAYVAGSTSSPDFPIANPLQPVPGGGGDAFVAKLNATGSALLYSTYLGGTRGDSARGIAVDLARNAYITGGTSSTDFPTVSPLQAFNAGGSDTFVGKLVDSTIVNIVGMGDSIGEGVQSADANFFTQFFSYLNLIAWRTGADFPLPVIVTTALGVVGDTEVRFRADPTVQGLNLAVSGADVNSLLNDRADSVIDSETDLVLLPRTGSQMEIAELLGGTFVACWIGNNDALGAVTAFDHLDASQLSSVENFTRDFSAIATRLKDAGSKVVFGTIPDVTRIGFLLTRDDVVALLGSDFGMSPGDRTTIVTFFLVALNLLPPDILQNPDFVLTAEETVIISSRIQEFNQIINNVAAANGMGVADIHQRFEELSANPPRFFGIPLRTHFLGGLFSLDGVHPSNIAHALIANDFLQAFNTTYGTNSPLIEPTILDSLFLTDPFVDKDGDGKVTGRPGVGLLETLMPFLGHSGDPNDFDGRISATVELSDIPTHWRFQAQARVRFLEEHARQTGRDLKKMSPGERIEEFRRIFGLARFRRRLPINREGRPWPKPSPVHVRPEFESPPDLVRE